MTTPQGVVRVHQHDQGVTFQMEGWGTMHQSPSVRWFAEQCLARGVTVLRVDLRYCTHMDSTFLGTLLFLKRSVDSQGQGEFALLSPSPQCRRLLQQMRLDKVLPIVTAEEPPTNAWVELKNEPDDVKTFKRNVVQAHQELANLEGPAGEPFRALVDDMMKELESEEAESDVHSNTHADERCKNG